MELIIEISQWDELELLVLQEVSEFDEDTAVCLGNKDNKTFIIIYDGFSLPKEIYYLCPVQLDESPAEVIEYFS